jgi:hypothetical protein
MDIAERAEILLEHLKYKMDAFDYRQDEYEALTSSALMGIQQKLKELNQKQKEGKTLLEMIGNL